MRGTIDGKSRRFGVAAACTGATLFSVCGVAIAAHPVDQAVYQGTAHAQYDRASDSHQTLTVSRNGKSLKKFRFEVRVTCTNGFSADLFNDNVGEPAIAVKSNGSFSGSYTTAQDLDNTSGHSTYTVHGSFTSARRASVTFTAAYQSGGAGGTVGGTQITCHGSVSFKMTAAPKLSKGAIRAPFGPTKPAARAGYRTVGQGNGYWEYVPNKK